MKNMTKEEIFYDLADRTTYPTFTVGRKGKLGVYVMECVAAGAHLPTPWLFEAAKHRDDRADYCLDCSFLPQWKHRVLVSTLEWSGARTLREQW